jgi:hypothetical protein
MLENRVLRRTHRNNREQKQEGRENFTTNSFAICCLQKILSE